MTNDDIVARLRGSFLPNDTLSIIRDEAADEIERLRRERDETRRAWCLYLAANTGLQKERIADLNGWDCYNQTPNDIEAHEVRGDVPGINL